MTVSYLPYGYIDQFDGLNLRTSLVLPLLCRLKSPRTARILTLANGRAINAAASTVKPIFPVDQELELLIHGQTAGSGATVDSLFSSIMAKSGVQGVLRVRVPSGARTWAAQAIFDYGEIVDDGQMDDSGVVNWSIIRLYFKQLELFHD